MPSFDVVSRVDMQEMDNAVNNSAKEIQTRYDLRGSKWELTLDRKEGKVRLVAEDKMKVKAIQDIFVSNLVRRKLDPKCLTWKEPEPTSQGHLKSEGTVRQGIDADLARRIVKMVKDTGLKVQSAVQDQQVRITGKKIDDLQAVIGALKEADIEVPLQYVNMKS